MAKQILKQDSKNFNKGTQEGDRLLEKSIKKFGFREAATLDKFGVLIGGNKRTAKAQKLGINDVQIIKADKNKIYALQYDDIDLDTPEGRELALALNQTAKANIVWDAEIIEANVEEAVIEEWGVGITEHGEGKNEDNTEKHFNENKYPLAIVLNKGYMIKWNELKEKLNLIQDTNAFIKILETYKLENND